MSEILAILVTGSRDYKNYDKIKTILDEDFFQNKNIILLHGRCSGLDSLAHKWALTKNINIKVFQPD